MLYDFTLTYSHLGRQNSVLEGLSAILARILHTYKAVSFLTRHFCLIVFFKFENTNGFNTKENYNRDSNFQILRGISVNL